MAMNELIKTIKNILILKAKIIEDQYVPATAVPVTRGIIFRNIAANAWPMIIITIIPDVINSIPITPRGLSNLRFLLTFLLPVCLRHQ